MGKMNESSAIEIYLAQVAPKYASLTPQQRAKDTQFCMLKETYCAALSPLLFGDKNKEDIRAVIEKYFPVLEEILPESGFVNGLDYPTVADLAVLNICEGYIMYGAAYKYGEVDLGKEFPKLLAHSDRTKADTDVAKVVSESKSLTMEGLGL